MVLFVEAITTNTNMGIIWIGLHQVHTKYTLSSVLNKVSSCGNIALTGPDDSRGMVTVVRSVLHKRRCH